MICKVCNKILVEQFRIAKFYEFYCGENSLDSHYIVFLSGPGERLLSNKDLEKVEYYQFDKTIKSCIRFYSNLNVLVGITAAESLNEVKIKAAEAPVFKNSEDMFNYLILA